VWQIFNLSVQESYIVQNRILIQKKIMKIILGLSFILIAEISQGTFVLPITLTRKWRWGMPSSYPIFSGLIASLGALAPLLFFPLLLINYKNKSNWLCFK